MNEEKLLNNLKDYLNYLKGKNLMTSFRFNIVDLLENSISLIEKQQKEIEDYQKCFEVIERHQKNQMQMQKNLWKRLKGGKNG